MMNRLGDQMTSSKYSAGRTVRRYEVQRNTWRGFAVSFGLHILVIVLIIIFGIRNNPPVEEKFVSVQLFSGGDGKEGSNGSPPSITGGQGFDIFAVTITEPPKQSIRTKTVAIARTSNRKRVVAPNRRWGKPVLKQSLAAHDQSDVAPPNNRTNEKLSADENYNLALNENLGTGDVGEKEATGSLGSYHSDGGKGLGGYPGGNGLGTGTGQGIGGPGNKGTGLGGYPGFSIDWGGGGTRKLVRFNVPKYPSGVNVEAQIKILATVLPDGSIKSLRPMQKGNTALENAAMNEARLWQFESLKPTQPQQEQTCVITFNFELR
jgi:hypothetical protein